MKTQNKDNKIQWLPILLIAWNVFDIALHVAIDRVEPLRITGNIVGIAAALIVLLRFAKPYAPYVLGLAAAAVVVLNALFASENGFGMVMLVLIGGSLFMLLRWGQMKLMEAVSQSGNTGTRFYQRWWTALLISLVGVAIIFVTG